MHTAITGISSMATRRVLAELAQAWQARGGAALALESVGGVDAARRVQAGEAFDAVFLASDAIDQLIASGHAVAGSKVDLVLSRTAVAVLAAVPSNIDPTLTNPSQMGSPSSLRQAPGGNHPS